MEDVAMSESHGHESVSWVDKYWQVLLIGFGLTFVAILVSFKPVI